MQLYSLIEQAELPAAMDVVIDLQKSVQSQSDSVRDFADKLKTEPALTAKLLRIANSAFYGAQSIETVEEAIMMIGTNDLVNLILAAEVMTAFEGMEYRISLAQFWRYNIYCAAAAYHIAKEVRRSRSRLFTCGLLRGVGALVLYRYMPEKSIKVMDVIDNKPDVPPYLLEQVEFSFHHGEVASALLQHWGLPETIYNTLRHYPNPSKADSDHYIDSCVLNVAYRATAEKFGLPCVVENDWLKTQSQKSDSDLIDDTQFEIQQHYEKAVTAMLPQDAASRPKIVVNNMQARA